METESPEFRWETLSRRVRLVVRQGRIPSVNVKVPLGAGAPSRARRSHRSHQRYFVTRIRSITCRFLAALACDVALYLVGYFALTYFGRLVFRRLAFPKILHKVVLSSSKARREQKLAEEAQVSEDAVATLEMTYASFWRRLGAYGLALGPLWLDSGLFS